MIVLQNIHSSVILTLKGTELNSKNHESLKALSKSAQTDDIQRFTELKHNIRYWIVLPSWENLEWEL